jgi:hypothetical protein
MRKKAEAEKKCCGSCTKKKPSVFFCPKCKKQMALWSTGKELRHYHCPGCCISKVEKKEEV